LITNFASKTRAKIPAANGAEAKKQENNFEIISQMNKPDVPV
jgi:hypothetical protein